MRKMNDKCLLYWWGSGGTGEGGKVVDVGGGEGSCTVQCPSITLITVTIIYLFILLLYNVGRLLG